MKTVLFFRDFKRLFGADLKVWHYFNYVLSLPDHTAVVRFSTDSVWDDSNPWAHSREHVAAEDMHVDADVLFLSGMDWEQLESSERERSSRPVINLVQSLWHACPDDPLGRYQSLSHKAIRISVSPEVTDAVIATGRVNGPIYTIPAAIDFDNVIAHTRPNSERDTDIAIFGKKEPELARRLAARLGRPGRGVQLIDRQISRADALDWMSRSNVTVMLARRKEGNPLPPLEGMALGTIVVSPDCIGNRAYCLPGVNCFRPDYDEDSIVQAAESAVHELPHLGEMIENAACTARQRDLIDEREAFLEILRSVDELWAGI